MPNNSIGYDYSAEQKSPSFHSQAQYSTGHSDSSEPVILKQLQHVTKQNEENQIDSCGTLKNEDDNQDNTAANCISGAGSINDPIIQKILANRNEMTDVSLADEEERLKRMYVMLRHSKKYKKMQVEEANKLWNEDLDVALLESKESLIDHPQSNVSLLSTELANLHTSSSRGHNEVADFFEQQDASLLIKEPSFSSSPTTPPKVDSISRLVRHHSLHEGIQSVNTEIQTEIAPATPRLRVLKKPAAAVNLNRVSFCVNVVNIPRNESASSETSITKSNDSNVSEDSHTSICSDKDRPEFSSQSESIHQNIIDANSEFIKKPAHLMANSKSSPALLSNIQI